jgi:CHAT domain-containing protein
MELTTLSNAFKVAGVPSIIASLWEVADRSTAVFMYNFYKNLGNKDTNKSEALRATQIGMMKDPQFSHPYYWAPFILIGDWK